MNLLSMAARAAAIKFKNSAERDRAIQVAAGLRRELDPAALALMPSVLLEAGAKSGSLKSFALARELGVAPEDCLEAALHALRPEAGEHPGLLAILPNLIEYLSGDQLGESTYSFRGMTFFERVCALADFESLSMALACAGDGASAMARFASREGSHPPLTLCSLKGSIPCCQLLLSMGADPNLEANSDQCQTSLMAAGKGGHAELCALLMGHGADPYLKRHDGATIMDMSEPPARNAMIATIEKREIARAAGKARAASPGKKPSL